MELKATWTKLFASPEIQRSSHSVSVVGDNVLVYGGELRPREPVDSAVHIINLGNGALTSNSQSPSKATTDTPQPRVGAASTTLDSTVYIFSGRGGLAMTPLEQHGALWSFSPTENSWSLVQPADQHEPFPCGRSYHAMTSNQHDTIYLHAGCPEKGRLADLWSFHLPSRKWTELAPAPDPPRGGPSIAYLAGKVYRMNGFDGKHEQGGWLDVYDETGDSWSSIRYNPEFVEGPSARSVGCLCPITVEGKHYLVTIMGEGDPSNLGHEGAGKMLKDAWAFDVEGLKWSKVHVEGGSTPLPRGWFDADVLRAGDGIVISGGLAESNERLDDVWMLQF